jgi:hypothetical protein
MERGNRAPPHISDIGTQDGSIRGPVPYWQNPSTQLLVEQSLHAAPRTPHVEALDFWQVPPWQHPDTQLMALQLPLPLEPLELPDPEPLDDPDVEPEPDEEPELPEVPDEELVEPLELPLEVPDELPLPEEDDVGPAHVPLWQD